MCLCVIYLIPYVCVFVSYYVFIFKFVFVWEFTRECVCHVSVCASRHTVACRPVAVIVALLNVSIFYLINSFPYMSVIRKTIY